MIIKVLLITSLFSHIAMIKCASVSEVDPDSELLKLPINFERQSLVRVTLDQLQASADESLINIMVELTQGYNEDQIKDLVMDMVKESETMVINPDVCLKKLTEAIHKYDKEEELVEKLTRLAKITSAGLFSIQRESGPAVNKPLSIPQADCYPLLADVFYPDKTIFVETVDQLKQGRFKKEFSRGILLYGPPGVGKNEMIQAMVHESDCRIFSTTASELVTTYQGSGAMAIKSLFEQAKAVDSSKGVIVLIDELQSITPVTTDKQVRAAHTHSGQDYANTLTQFWIEYDRCLKDHDNIMIIATCNEFNRIDERIRGRFDCIKFSYPDEEGTMEILTKKANYFGVPLSDAEVKEYTEKMKGVNGRDLVKFIKNAKRYIRNGKSKEEALQLAMNDQKNTNEDTKSTEPNRRIEQLKDEALRGTAHGFGTQIGQMVVAGAATAVLIGLKMFFSGNENRGGSNSNSSGNSSGSSASSAAHSS